MKDVYQILNITSNMEYNRFVESLDLDENQLTNLFTLLSSNPTKEQILDLTASFGNGTYEKLVEQINKKPFKRELKETSSVSGQTHDVGEVWYTEHGVKLELANIKYDDRFGGCYEYNFKSEPYINVIDNNWYYENVFDKLHQEKQTEPDWDLEESKQPKLINEEIYPNCQFKFEESDSKIEKEGKIIKCLQNIWKSFNEKTCDYLKQVEPFSNTVQYVLNHSSFDDETASRKMNVDNHIVSIIHNFNNSCYSLAREGLRNGGGGDQDLLVYDEEIDDEATYENIRNDHDLEDVIYTVYSREDINKFTEDLIRYLTFNTLDINYNWWAYSSREKFIQILNSIRNVDNDGVVNDTEGEEQPDNSMNSTRTSEEIMLSSKLMTIDSEVRQIYLTYLTSINNSFSNNCARMKDVIYGLAETYDFEDFANDWERKIWDAAYDSGEYNVMRLDFESINDDETTRNYDNWLADRTPVEALNLMESYLSNYDWNDVGNEIMPTIEQYFESLNLNVENFNYDDYISRDENEPDWDLEESKQINENKERNYDNYLDEQFEKLYNLWNSENIANIDFKEVGRINSELGGSKYGKCVAQTIVVMADLLVEMYMIKGDYDVFSDDGDFLPEETSDNIRDVIDCSNKSIEEQIGNLISSVHIILSRIISESRDKILSILNSARVLSYKIGTSETDTEPDWDLEESKQPKLINESDDLFSDSESPNNKRCKEGKALLFLKEVVDMITSCGKDGDKKYIEKCLISIMNSYHSNRDLDLIADEFGVDKEFIQLTYEINVHLLSLVRAGIYSGAGGEFDLYSYNQELDDEATMEAIDDTPFIELVKAHMTYEEVEDFTNDLVKNFAKELHMENEFNISSLNMVVEVMKKTDQITQNDISSDEGSQSFFELLGTLENNESKRLAQNLVLYDATIRTRLLQYFEIYLEQRRNTAIFIAVSDIIEYLKTIDDISINLYYYGIDWYDGVISDARDSNLYDVMRPNYDDVDEYETERAIDEWIDDRTVIEALDNVSYFISKSDWKDYVGDDLEDDIEQYFKTKDESLDTFDYNSFINRSDENEPEWDLEESKQPLVETTMINGIRMPDERMPALVIEDLYGTDEHWTYNITNRLAVAVGMATMSSSAKSELNFLPSIFSDNCYYNVTDAVILNFFKGVRSVDMDFLIPYAYMINNKLMITCEIISFSEYENSVYNSKETSEIISDYNKNIERNLTKFMSVVREIRNVIETEFTSLYVSYMNVGTINWNSILEKQPITDVNQEEPEWDLEESVIDNTNDEETLKKELRRAYNDFVESSSYYLLYWDFVNSETYEKIEKCDFIKNECDELIKYLKDNGLTRIHNGEDVWDKNATRENMLNKPDSQIYGAVLGRKGYNQILLDIKNKIDSDATITQFIYRLELSIVDNHYSESYESLDTDLKHLIVNFGKLNDKNRLLANLLGYMEGGNADTDRQNWSIFAENLQEKLFNDAYKSGKFAVYEKNPVKAKAIKDEVCSMLISILSKFDKTTVDTSDDWDLEESKQLNEVDSYDKDGFWDRTDNKAQSPKYPIGTKFYELYDRGDSNNVIIYTIRDARIYNSHGDVIYSILINLVDDVYTNNKLTYFGCTTYPQSTIDRNIRSNQWIESNKDYHKVLELSSDTDWDLMESLEDRIIKVGDIIEDNFTGKKLKFMVMRINRNYDSEFNDTSVVLVNIGNNVLKGDQKFIGMSEREVIKGFNYLGNAKDGSYQYGIETEENPYDDWDIE